MDIRTGTGGEMNRSLFYRVLVCSLVVVFGVCTANAAEKFDLCTFFENPFIGKEMFPDKFNSYAEFEKHFKNEPFVCSSEAVTNRYDETKQDIRVKLESENILLYYLCSGDDGRCFLQLMQVVPDKKLILKYGIHKGMDESAVIGICGKNFYRHTFERNYELCFSGNEPWQVNFSFKRENKTLSAINFWYGIE